MKKILLFVILFLVVLFFFAGLFFFYEARFFSSRASTTKGSFSIDNSYIFVTPLKGKANSQERIRVTVFILNDQGLGVPGKTVVIAQDPGIVLDSNQGVTDSLGKVIFDIAGKQAGEYYLEIAVDETKLTQKAHLSYY